MRTTTATRDWVATVDALVRRTPASASERDPLRAQVRLLALLSSGAPVNVLLGALATYVETWAEGLHCTILLVDPTGRLLRPGAAPSLPDAYTQAIDPVPIGIGEGSCGTAAACRKMVVVEDVEKSDLWAKYASLALSHGLRACWSVPIFDDARALLGTLALYYRERRAPSQQEIDLIEFASSLTAFVIQRHRDAKKLRTTDALLEAAIWGTDIGLWASGIDGDYSWFDNWCERSDIDRCDGPGQERRWCERIHPDDVERHARAADDAARGVTQHYIVEYRILTRSGNWHWLHERGKVTERDGSGVAQRFVGVCFVIDQQKKMEAALRTSEDRYELAVAAARLPVWEYDVATDAFIGNAYWHQVSGRDVTEAEARRRVETWLSDVHPNDATRISKAFSQDAADATGFFQSEFRIRAATGEYKWLLERGRVVERAPDGAPRRVMGISLDIDARKRMETALRESEERFRGAFEFAAIGMALVAPDGRWLRVNHALCGIVGYTAEELLATTFQAITHPEDLDADMEHVRQMLDGSLSHYDMEKRYFHRDGHIVWILLSVSLVRDEAGQPLYFVSQIQDITARKRLERALREVTHQEQLRIGKEIHDGLGQELLGVALLARGLAASARKGRQPNVDELDRLSLLASRTISTCQGIAQGLAPLSEAHGGLVQALHDLVDRQSESDGPAVRFDAIEGAPIRLQLPAADHMFRIAQEGLTNALKHAGAQSIKVTLNVQSDIVRLEIVDDGVGVLPRAVESGGRGLKVMRYRAEMIDAHLSIGPGENGGTTLVCECRQPA